MNPADVEAVIENPDGTYTVEVIFLKKFVDHLKNTVDDEDEIETIIQNFLSDAVEKYEVISSCRE